MKLKSSLLLAIIAVTVLCVYQNVGSQEIYEKPPRDFVPTDLRPNNTVGNNFWTWRGPQHNAANLEGPQVNTIVIDPSNPNIVYAGTNQGVYRSSNSGESWELRNEGLGGYGDLVISELAIDPTNTARIIIGTWGSGVWQSINAGATWTKLSDPLANVMQNHKDQETVKELPPEISGVGPSYHYHDDRIDVQPEGLPISWQRTAVRSVSINPNNPAEIFACVDDGQGLYRSANGGATWQYIELGEGSARTYTFAPSNNQIRYASFGSWSTSGGFFRTTNGGATWTEVGAETINGTVTAVAIHPTNSNLVQAATANDGLYRSSDGGSSWQKVSTNLTDNTFFSVAYAPSNPSIVYAGGYSWVYLSQDGGATWSIADTSFPARYIEGLAIHPTQAQTVWIGSGSNAWGGVYKRTSSSARFEFKPAGMEDTIVLDIEQDPNQPQRLFAATWGGGAFISTNGGQNWTKISQLPPYVYDLEAVADGSSTVVYATTFYSDYGIFKSEDAGATWYEVSWQYPSYISFDIESIYNNPNRLVAATFDGIQYSFDGGANWYPASVLNTNSGIVLSICEFPGTGRMLAATYGGGIFYSWGGYWWYEANSGLLTQAYSGYTYDVACAADTPGLAYAAGLGISQTTDYGETWTVMAGGLPNDYFRSIVVAPGTGDVFAASANRGVYFSPGGSSLWTQINEGLMEKRTRSIAVVGRSPTKIMVGTNGLGVWEYTVVNRPLYSTAYLPAVGKNSESPPTCRQYEPNNNSGQATVLRTPGAYCSYINDSSDVDYYRINVTRLGPVTIELTNIPAGNDYDIQFFDSDRNLLLGSYRWSNQNEKIVYQPTQTGFYYIRVFSFSGSNPHSGYYLKTSYNGSRGTGQIYGAVQYDGATISNLPVQLVYANGYRSQAVATKTDNVGTFRFRGMQTLPVGHSFYVNYVNYTSNDQYLWLWQCYGMTGYRSQQNLEFCSFDIKNVFARSPAHGSTVHLPVTFTWSRRNVPGDSYELTLYSPSSSSAYWRSSPLGNVESYTLSALPAGFNLDEPYYWEILVHNEGGIGFSYYVQEITFSNVSIAATGNSLGIVNQASPSHFLLDQEQGGGFEPGSKETIHANP